MPNQKEDLDKLTVKELREIAVKLGMTEEDAENFETKKPLISTINTLSKAQAVEKGELKKEKEQYLSKKEIMWKKWMSQPQVRIRIPCEGKEKPGVIEWVLNKKTNRKEQKYISGAYTPVQGNGAKYLVAHGRYENVPQEVADKIAESQNDTTDAGKKYLIDRDDPKTGKSVRDALE